MKIEDQILKCEEEIKITKEMISFCRKHDKPMTKAVHSDHLKFLSKKLKELKNKMKGF